MSGDSIELLGYAAATCTTVSFVPQAIKVIRTRHTADLSLAGYTIFAAGVALWLIYGCLIASWPVMLANSLTLLLVSCILALKLRHG